MIMKRNKVQPNEDNVGRRRGSTRRPSKKLTRFIGKNFVSANANANTKPVPSKDTAPPTTTRPSASSATLATATATTTSVNSGNNRRVIFPTLYECASSQSSPLYKNQVRGYHRPLPSPLKIIHINRVPDDVLDRRDSVLSITSSLSAHSELSHTKHSRASDSISGSDLATIPMSNKRTKQDSASNSSGPCSGPDPDQGQDQDSSPQDPGQDQDSSPQDPMCVTDECKDMNKNNNNNSSNNGKDLTSSPHRPQTPNIIPNTVSQTSLQSLSPTSIANDIHKKVPGPSILKRKNKSMQIPAIVKKKLPPQGTTKGGPLDKLNKTIHSIVSLKDMFDSQGPRDQKQDTLSSPSASSLPEVTMQPASTAPQPESSPLCSNSDLRRSSSDSCINRLESLTISRSNQGVDPTSTSSSSTNNNNSNINNPIFFTRHISHEEMNPCNKKIRFDPRVWVHEIQHTELEENWYTQVEMQQFKHEAILRIRQWTIKEHKKFNASTGFDPNMIATGTGRIISRKDPLLLGSGGGGGRRQQPKALYTNPALTLEAEEDDHDQFRIAMMRQKQKEAMAKEFRKVLLVDCHDILLKLLTKYIKSVMPNVIVTTANSVEEAIEKMNVERQKGEDMPSLSSSTAKERCTHGFDMIVVEERLRRNPRVGNNSLIHGHDLAQYITSDIQRRCNKNSFWGIIGGGDVEKNCNNRYPLVVGMSAYLEQDKPILEKSGVDFVWNKPPPEMNEKLRNLILRTIMDKRGRENVEDFFDGAK